ncbi:hypothetical protein OKW39_002264 [Paraburkholderia sp. MM6662-R1]
MAMPHSKKIATPATEQDLEWFQPRHYAGLENFTVLEWTRLVGDRLNIRRAVDGGCPGAVAGVFEILKKEPLKWLGSDVRYIGADHEANTATVKSMNLRRLGFLINELDTTQATGDDGYSRGDDDGDLWSDLTESPDAVVDEILATNSQSSFQRFAHVTVSLEFPRESIIEDFKTWLERELQRRGLPEPDKKNGNYMDKAKNQWIPHCAVQWYDLDLFERLTGLSVPSVFRWSSLFPGARYETLDSKKKKAANAATLLFSEDTYRVLRRLANDLPTAQAPD